MKRYALAIFLAAIANAQVRVQIFARTDCPVTNRYAPEIRRLADEFSSSGIVFEMVYPDPGSSEESIRKHIAEYNLPVQWTRDPDHALVKKARVATAPEAAVFDREGNLRYHGRIDNLWISPGKARAAATVHDLEDAIRAVLAGKTVAVPETRAVGCSLLDVQ